VCVNGGMTWLILEGFKCFAVDAKGMKLSFKVEIMNMLVILNPKSVEWITEFLIWWWPRLKISPQMAIFWYHALNANFNLGVGVKHEGFCHLSNFWALCYIKLLIPFFLKKTLTFLQILNFFCGKALEYILSKLLFQLQFKPFKKILYLFLLFSLHSNLSRIIHCTYLFIQPRPEHTVQRQ
jgi:hypothetical protein